MRDMGRLNLAIIVGLAAIFSTSPAAAVVTGCLTQDCAATSNTVVFPVAITGNPIVGGLNGPSAQATFTSNESVTGSMVDGVGRVAATDGEFFSLLISLGGTTTFNAFQIDLNAVRSGSSTFTFYGVGGTTLFTSQSDGYSTGADNFRGFSGDNFTAVQIDATRPLVDVRNIRFGGINAVAVGTPGAVPEPATWAMMLLGFGGIGMAVRRGRVSARTQIA